MEKRATAFQHPARSNTPLLPKNKANAAIPSPGEYYKPMNGLDVIKHANNLNAFSQQNLSTIQQSKLSSMHP